MDPITVTCETRPGLPPALTVTQLARVIRETVRGNPILSRILVRGEVSNLQRAPAGHVFFSLKDATSQLACVLFRDDAAGLGFDLEDGMDVVVSGDVDVFPRRGTVQLLVHAATPAGVGAFWAAYQRTRKKLAAEGLFDAARKRSLPTFPRRIGVVTSEIGAVVHDIVTILRRRYPLAHVIVAPALVQGPEAPASLRRALAFVGDRVDVVIVARGGGSLEDLWCFNDEGLARAAAELVSPDALELAARVNDAGQGLLREIREALAAARGRVTGFGERMSPRALRRGVEANRALLDRTYAALSAVAPREISRHRDRLDALSRGDLPLDRALAVFEEGLALYRRCHAILADSEQRVTKLVAAAEGLSEEPFPIE